jgi:hypothetical protein
MCTLSVSVSYTVLVHCVRSYEALAVTSFMLLIDAIELFTHVACKRLSQCVCCNVMLCMTIRLLDVHKPADKPASEADHWVNVAMWLEEHLLKL